MDVARIPSILEHLVRDTGLADEVCYLDAAGGEPVAQQGAAPDGTLVLVPVADNDAEPQGYLRCRPRPGALPTIRELALLAGAAMGEAARAGDLAARETALRRIAERLQDSLLPAVPALPATHIQVIYRAAAREARVGGDFYDVFCLPDGLVLLVVGDVMGKGVGAASRTSRITQTFRALAMQGMPLEDLLARVCEQVVFQDPELMATMWAGMYDPDSGQVVFGSCGHPPALLLRSDGTPTWLNVEGLPLGMHDLVKDAPETRTRQLGPRDLLVLYTDGLIEASGDVTAGQETLLQAVRARRNSSLSELVPEVTDELLRDAGHTDDAVLLVLRRV